jgi:hypothetical protein
MYINEPLLFQKQQRRKEKKYLVCADGNVHIFIHRAERPRAARVSGEEDLSRNVRM